MPRFSRSGKFLHFDDLPSDGDTVVTIKSFKEMVFEQEGETQRKWALSFAELDQPLILNQINGKLISKALGTDEMSEWVDRKIALYVRDDIEFRDKLVSGIRVRAKEVGYHGKDT